jgi:hypothetical protein
MRIVMRVAALVSGAVVVLSGGVIMANDVAALVRYGHVAPGLVIAPLLASLAVTGVMIGWFIPRDRTSE